VVLIIIWTRSYTAELSAQ